ncbi:hypothetical protein V6N13_072576 [Hibiscus sabdariffa]
MAGGNPSVGNDRSEDGLEDLLAAKGQSGQSTPKAPVGGGEADVGQGCMGVKEFVHSATSFKETLLSNSAKSRVSHPIDELDVEIADEDVRIGGDYGTLESGWCD